MYYDTYWGMSIGLLNRNRDDARIPDAKCGREIVYDVVREKTGLDFADFGDDVDRWLAWLEADDTSDANEIRRRHQEEWERSSDEVKRRVNKMFGIE